MGLSNVFADRSPYEATAAPADGAQPAAPDAIAVPGPEGSDTSRGSIKVDLGDVTHPFFNGSITPLHWNIANQIAQQAQTHNTRDELMTSAMAGVAPAVKVDQDRQAQREQKIAQIVQQTGHMDDSQFAGIEKQLMDEMGKQPQLPQPTNPQAPNWAQAIVGGIAALAMPHYAFNIGRTVFQHGLDEAKDQDQRNMAQFQNDSQARNLRIATYSHLLSEVNQRDLAKMQDERARQVAEIGANSRRDVAFYKGSQIEKRQTLDAYYNKSGNQTVEGQNNARQALIEGFGEDPGTYPAVTQENARQIMEKGRGHEAEAKAGLENAKAVQVPILTELAKKKYDESVRVDNARIAAFTAKAGLDNVTATRVAKQVSQMDDDHAIAVAKAESAMNTAAAKVASMQFGDKVKAAQLDQKQLADYGANIRGGLQAYHNAIVATQKQLQNAQLMASIERDPTKLEMYHGLITELTNRLHDEQQSFNDFGGRAQSLNTALAQHLDLGKYPEVGIGTTSGSFQKDQGAATGAQPATATGAMNQWLDKNLGAGQWSVTVPKDSAVKLINDAVAAAAAGRDWAWIKRELAKKLAGH